MPRLFLPPRCACRVFSFPRSVRWATAPAPARRRDIDHQRDHDPDDGPEAPLPSPPVHHRRVPQERGGEKDEAENRPQERGKETAEPGREDREEHDRESRSAECDDGKQAGHERTPPGSRPKTQREWERPTYRVSGEAQETSSSAALRQTRFSTSPQPRAK